MKNLTVPLISPLSRKYYQYAFDSEEKIHHRAEDVRICLEKICDSIIIQLVSPATKMKWGGFKLHHKLESCNEFMDPIIVKQLLNAKAIGNIGAHEGEEGNYSQQDINDCLEAIKEFSLEVFYSFFVRNGFGDSEEKSWIPTVFSTLPPIYRIYILEKYYTVKPTVFVINKLSKAYLKNNMKEKAYDFINQCYDKGQINAFEFEVFKNDLKLLEPNLKYFCIARNLEEAKTNFLNLLPAIDEDDRDTFVILFSIILTGDLPN